MSSMTHGLSYRVDCMHDACKTFCQLFCQLRVRADSSQPDDVCKIPDMMLQIILAEVYLLPSPPLPATLIPTPSPASPPQTL